MAHLPNTEPPVIQAGDTTSWQRDLPDYPADQGWQLSYLLINPAGRINITTTASGSSHLATISAAVSAGYAAGAYTWLAQVTRTDERFTVGQGDVTIKADWAAAPSGADARSPAARALADLRAALLNWLSTNGQISEYEIAGRRMRFATAQEIRQRIALAEREVNREALALSGNSGARRVLVRF